MTNLPYFLANGSFDRSFIMRTAHQLARKYFAIGAYDSYAEAFKAELKGIWSSAQGHLAILQARTGQTREYVCVARDVMLLA